MAKKPEAKKVENKGPKTDMTVHGGGMDLIPLDSKQLPDHIQKGDKRGTENLGIQDLVIPRLEIVQGLSPAVKRGDPGFINGAAPGMLNNSVTRDLYGEKVWLIGVHYAVQYLVWRDRKMVEAHNQQNPRNKLPTEGGFFGAYSTVEEAKARAEAEGGESQCIMVVDTPTHLCLLMNQDKGELEEIMLSMPKTKAKISRQWNTMVKLANKARFAMAYEVTTVLQKNPKGDFYNYVINPIGFTPKPMFERAAALFDAVNKGERKMRMDTAGLNPGEEHDDLPAGKM